MAIDYRQATPDDLAQLMPLAEAYALDQQARMPINTLTDEFMEYARKGMAEAVEHPAGCVMVAVEKMGFAEQIVGYGVGFAQEPPAMFTPELYTLITDLFVLPEFRRQGIGTSLMERIRGWGWVKGINRISLVVPQESPVTGILEKLGFKPFQTMYYYGDKP